MINLISDTVTRPSEAMLKAMMSAEVGDDVFKGDPTVNELQRYAAELFGMEDALFCPSGTMTNQIALAIHCGRLEEVVCDKLSHIYRAEVGGYAYNSNLAIKLLDGENGKVTAEQVAAAINPNNDWLARTRLVVLENTANLGGGAFYTLDEVAPIATLCKERGLGLHLDGARLFNALVETQESPAAWGATFDSISICLSKGLGAPVGSLLLGKSSFIAEARRLRKAMGGGMRQAGYLAAAGLYALQHNTARLADDHRRARRLAEALSALPYVTNIRPVQTNILIFDLHSPYNAESYLTHLNANGILASAFGPQTIRFVTHLDFTEDMLEKVLLVLSH